MRLSNSRTLRGRCVQARRIRCDACGAPFGYMAESLERITTDAPAFSSEEEIQERARLEVMARLRNVAKAQRLGQGPCPHCGRYQSWMISRSRRRRAVPWGLGTLPVAWAVAWGNLGSVVGGLVVGVAAAAVAAWIASRGALPAAARAGTVHPGSIGDEDLRSLLVHCRAVDGDPATEWYLSFHKDVPKGEVLLPMGCRDLVGEDFFPYEFTADSVLAEG